MDAIIRKHFPSLNDLRFVQALSEVGELMDLPAGEVIMDYGRRIEHIPLLYEGSVQVFRRDDQGREIFLYYLKPGDACAITLVCSGHDKISRIHADTLEPSRFILVPISCMDEWMMTFKVWYYYVVETYSYRFEEALKSFDQVAFSKMDERLHKFLSDHGQIIQSKTITLTHQQIADALFTSREVVSRLLKQMENEGEVRLERNRIHLNF